MPTSCGTPDGGTGLNSVKMTYDQRNSTLHAVGCAEDRINYMQDPDPHITPDDYQALAERAAKRMSGGHADELSTKLFFSLLRMGNRLSKDFEVAIRRNASLSFAGYQLLYTLNAVGRMNSNQLARIAGVSTASMSSLLNTLERKGLVLRQDDPKDGRRTIVTLTENGEDLIFTLYRQNVDRELAWSQALPRQEAEQLWILIDKLLKHRPRPVGIPPTARQFWDDDAGANTGSGENWSGSLVAGPEQA